MEEYPLTSVSGRKSELPFRLLRREGDDSLRGYRIPYPGMDKVVDLATDIIEHYRGVEFVRDKALNITGRIAKNQRTGHPDMRNYDAIAKAVHDWIAKNIKYVRDQNGIERIQTPDATLKLKTGDCDDMAILGASLLESVGVPTRVKLIGSKPGKFSHIFIEYRTNGTWKSFDPTLALYPGYVHPKGAIRAEKNIPIHRPGTSNGDSSQTQAGSGYVSGANKRAKKKVNTSFNQLLLR